MARGKGRPPLAPGDALTEVISIKVSPATKEFYAKFAGLLHTEEITPAIIVRNVLERFRYDVEAEAEDRWLMNLNSNLSGKEK